MLSELFTNCKKTIDLLSGNNQIISGAIVLWLLGVSSYMLRNIPIKIFDFLKKHFTTTVTVTNDNKSFYEICDWLEYKGISKRSRTLKFNNGVWGTDKSKLSVGYGKHFFLINKKFVWIDLVKEDGSASHKTKESLKITTLGRNKKLCEKIILDTKNKDKENNCTYTYINDHWYRHGKQSKRNFNNVTLSNTKLETIKEHLDKFVNNETWYLEKGVPYQLGMLLHGPPGTGKTSVIKAIADYLSKNIAICPANNFHKIQEAFSCLPDNSIIVLEDIDSNPSIRDRCNEEEIDDKYSYDKETAKYGLSEILNSIDGLVGNHGRIMIMTTNKPNSLDQAFMRPGRVDLSLEIGYLDDETFKSFLGRFYENVPNNLILNKRDLTCAELQNDVLSGLTLKEIINRYTNSCIL